MLTASMISEGGKQMPVLAAEAQPSPPAAAVEQLMSKDMLGVPNKELLMLTVEYPPGGASLPHRHDAQVLVYMLEGAVIMQVAGSPALTLSRGQTFYEHPRRARTVQRLGR
jgi:quercetin dioxygenase-like cupin family protein